MEASRVHGAEQGSRAGAGQAPRRLPALEAGLRALASGQMVNSPVSTPESFTVVWCVVGDKGLSYALSHAIFPIPV